MFPKTDLCASITSFTDFCARFQGAAAYGYGKVSAGGNAEDTPMIISTRKVGLQARDPFSTWHVNLTL